MIYKIKGEGVDETGVSYGSASAIESYMQEIDGKNVTLDDLVLLSAFPKVDENGNPVDYDNTIIPNIEIIETLHKDDAPLFVMNKKTKRVEPMMVVEDDQTSTNGIRPKYLLAGEDLTEYLDKRLSFVTNEDLKPVEKPKFVKEPGGIAKFFDKWFGITFSSITKHKKYLADMKKYTNYVKATAYTNMKKTVEESKTVQKLQQEHRKKAEQEKLQKEQQEKLQKAEQKKLQKNESIEQISQNNFSPAENRDKNFVNSVSWLAYNKLSEENLPDEEIVSAFATIMATHTLLEPDEAVAKMIDEARNAGPETGVPSMADGLAIRRAARTGIAGNNKKIDDLRNEVMNSDGFKAFVTKDESGKLIPNDKMREHVQKMVNAHNKPGKSETEREAEQYLRECDCNKEMQAHKLVEEKRNNDKNLHLHVQNVKENDLKMQTP